ncbi:MAG: twin-arginine translocation signal domain-containing protein [Cyclobacteriaceae bacterium]|nr:twin-arginine translocation signal domain-containing protein [Cyclobacteriaceae bacterium]
MYTNLLLHMHDKTQSYGVTRRKFIKTAATGSLAAVGLGMLSPEAMAAIDNQDTMKITKIEAVRFNDRISIGGGSGGSGKAEFCWVRLHRDRGITGTGETYPFSNGELGTLKDYAKDLIGIKYSGRYCVS